MKIRNLLLTTSICAVTALPALAQGQRFSTVDADGNGGLSMTELSAVFGSDQAKAIMNKRDMNGDGMITAAELQMSYDDDESDDDESSDDDSYDDDESDDDESYDDDESDDDESDDDSSDESDDDSSDDSGSDDSSDESDDD